MVRVRLASLTLAGSLLMSSGCMWWDSWSARRVGCCGSQSGGTGVAGFSGFTPGGSSNCNCTQGGLYHPTGMSHDGIPTGSFPEGSIPINTSPTPYLPPGASPQPAPPRILNVPPANQPAMAVPVPAPPH